MLQNTIKILLPLTLLLGLPMHGGTVCPAPMQASKATPAMLASIRQNSSKGFFKQLRAVKQFKKALRGQVAAGKMSKGGLFAIILLGILLLAGLIWFAAWSGTNTGGIIKPLQIVLIAAVVVAAFAVLFSMGRKPKT